jgi:hypothetical protein
MFLATINGGVIIMSMGAGRGQSRRAKRVSTKSSELLAAGFPLKGIPECGTRLFDDHTYNSGGLETLQDMLIAKGMFGKHVEIIISPGPKHSLQGSKESSKLTGALSVRAVVESGEKDPSYHLTIGRQSFEEHLDEQWGWDGELEIRVRELQGRDKLWPDGLEQVEF